MRNNRIIELANNRNERAGTSFRFPVSIIRLFDYSIIATRKGFTLIELLVVIAMLAVLMGALTSSVSQARRRAQIAKATQDVKEITNAILGFENYAPNHSLESYATGGWKETDEGGLKMILGGETTESGETVPVLYNAHIVNGMVRDPWGTPYQFIIKKVTGGASGGGGSPVYVTAPNLPNFYRLSDEERQ